MSRVYLDWNATTPLRQEARDAMIAAMDLLGNPSSVHAEGRAARAQIERAREDVGNMVGVGVFTSLGFQLLDIQSGFVILVLWALGGLIALCGAMTYAELGAALPRSGGEYNFLSRIFHPAVGFASGWTSATIGFAAGSVIFSSVDAS